MNQRFKTILLFGAPGSGKGTQGKMLGKLPGFVHVACGKLNVSELLVPRDFSLQYAEELRRKILWSLGCVATSLASAAFNNGEGSISKQLSEFAIGVCPEVKRSLLWRKLACKRWMGSGAWRALRQGVARFRKVVLLVKELAH